MFTLCMGTGQKTGRRKRKVKRGSASLSVLGAVCIMPGEAEIVIISFAVSII